MEIDTGAAVSLISQELKDSMFPNVQLRKSSLVLRTYTAEPISVVGEIEVEVQYGKYTGCHRLQVVGNRGPPLLGRDWLKRIRLDWANIRSLTAVTVSPAVEALLTQYAGVFQPGLGLMK